jgi:hypothetical protein
VEWSALILAGVQPEDRRVHAPRNRVHYRVGEQTYEGDLVFQSGRPVLVISWRIANWKRVPYISLPLDAAYLKPMANTPGVYVYLGTLAIANKMFLPPAGTSTPLSG